MISGKLYIFTKYLVNNSKWGVTMAIMVDKKPGYKGEALVWESLSMNLPNDVVVYNTREIVDDREFDFALLIKGLGVLVIEVKGWEAKYIFEVSNVDTIVIVSNCVSP